MPKAVTFSRHLPSDPFQLHSVEEWLRGFREQQLPNMANVFYCRKCGIRTLASPEPVIITDHPCGPVRRLDEAFWQRLSNRIKPHYRKDPLLFARLNAEEVFPPRIPDLNGSLAWVTIEWRNAAMPPGRPRNLEKQLLFASWLTALARPRLVMEHGEHPSELWIFEPSAKPRRLYPKGDSKIETKPPRRGVFPPIMTLSGAIQVLTGNDLRDAIARTVPWRQRQLFGGLSIRKLTQIRSAFRKQWKKQFGEVPRQLDRREAERILTLQKSFQSGGKVRVKGIKLRERASKKVGRASGLRAQLPGPDEGEILRGNS